MTAPFVLGIETSCDETAAAVVQGTSRVLSNVVATQHDLHRRYAGVVPEIASRAHLERIIPVVREALGTAGVGWGDLEAIGVAHRPGLIGSLLVGTSAAKALAWALGVPLVGVDHVVAHLHAGLLDDEPVSYPALGLVVSGGHSSLFLVEGALEVTLLGRTIDDAVGEAYDKAATILGLEYPGGPAIDRLAADGDETAHCFPVAKLGPESLDFSFSGLKTALLYAVTGGPPRPQRRGGGPVGASHLSAKRKADLAASFQRAAVTAILEKVKRALDRHPVAALLVGGGVSANRHLRSQLEALARRHRLDLRLPRPAYCLDNAAMIGGLAAAKYAAGDVADLSLAAAARSEIASGRSLR